METRETKQKKIILDSLKENKNHPTIKELYDDIKKDNPDIGMATVYRNINKFADSGKVIKLSTKDGNNHYDYYKDHFHLVCLNCGKIIDIYDNELIEELSKRFKNKNELITNYSLILEGYCSSCRKEKEGK